MVCELEGVSWSDEQIGILDVRGQVTRSELDYAS